MKLMIDIVPVSLGRNLYSYTHLKRRLAEVVGRGFDLCSTYSLLYSDF